MHLQIILRGVNTQVELWKIMAQAQYFKWIRKDLETGKDFEVIYQMALRPSVLGTWELVFPEECLATVLSILGFTEDWKGIYGNVSMLGMRMAVMRKMCGVKKIPKKFFKEAEAIPESLTMIDSWRGLSHLMIKGVAVHVIGIKKDDYGEMFDPVNQKIYYQELL